MKKALLILSIGWTLFSCENDKLSVGNKTKIEVVSVVDKGDVMLGEEVKASFTVKNTGNYPLILAEVKGSCTCTVAQYPKDPIPPGETATITAVVSTEKANPGTLTKDVRILANTEPSLTSVLIKANVIRK